MGMGRKGMLGISNRPRQWAAAHPLLEGGPLPIDWEETSTQNLQCSLSSVTVMQSSCNRPDRANLLHWPREVR